MTTILHRNFKKQILKIPDSIKRKFKKRRDLFLKNPLHPLLNNHPLGGGREGQWSFNVTGDWRVLYKVINTETVIFMEIGTHDSLYRK